jgi:hypothetical protein
VRYEEGLEVELHLLERGGEALDLGFGLGGHFGVVNGNELARLRELVFIFADAVGQLDDRTQSLMLTSQRGELARILRGRRVRQFALDFGSARDGVCQAVAEAQADFPAYF